MRIGPESQNARLKELSALLASEQIPVQKEVAAKAGVAQSLVSRARNGLLRRVTEKVDRLFEYAQSRVASADLAAIAAVTLDAEAEDAPASTGVNRQDGKRLNDFRRKAIEGVEAYLADGYDPRLIVEQLAVLRRAQRMRRPGSPAGR